MSARTLAIQVLSRVAATDAYLNVVLDTVLAESPPKDSRDAGLTTELVYGTTRRQLAIDYALAPLASRKLETLEDKVLAALRIGAYQLFFMRVPRHAAVGDTVQALKELGMARASGFVNAILRKLSAMRGAAPPAGGRSGHLPLHSREPPRVAGAPLDPPLRTRARGGDARRQQPRRAADAAREHREAPIASRCSHASRRRGWRPFPTSFSPVGIIVPHPGRVEDLDGYDEGLWQVQDEAAQLVGIYAAIPEGARVYDACAAPGGKACHLAERLEVLAADRARQQAAEDRGRGPTPRALRAVEDAGPRRDHAASARGRASSTR